MGIVLLAGACAAPFAELPGKTYARAVTKLGIFPVYPPREDLQVGDVYAVEIGKVKDDLERRSAFVDTINMTAAIQTVLNSRYKFATTSDFTGEAQAAAAGKTAPSQAVQTDAVVTGSLLARGTGDTLPIAAFPSFTVDTGVVIGAGGTTSSLFARLGFSAAKTQKVQLTFERVTSYGIAAIQAESSLRDYCFRNGRFAPECSENFLRRAIAAKFHKAPEQIVRSGISVITRVYLARKINYTFDDSWLASLAIAAGKSQTPTYAPIVDKAVLEAAVAKGDGATVEALAAIINAQSAAQKDLASDSIAFSLSAVSKTSVTLTALYPRPIVVGYESLDTDIEADCARTGCHVAAPVTLRPAATGDHPVLTPLPN